MVGRRARLRAPEGARLEAISRAFMGWLRPREVVSRRGATPHSAPGGAADKSPSPLASAKILIYRLIGLNAWAARRLDIYLSLRAYRKTFGRNPDLAKPSLFSEKITARKLFDRRPLMSQLADKLFAREFAAARIGPVHLPRLLMTCERFEEIDFDRLPDKFVIKANHGTHWVLLVDDKAALDHAAARKTVNRWMKTNYYVNSREYFYRDIKPRIMIEEFLEEPSGVPVIEFRFFVYDGAVKFLTVHQSKVLGGPRSNKRFNRALEKIPSAEPPEPMPELKMPSNIEDMFDLASRLGQGFDFIRVDLYAPGGRIVFGELTTLPMGGVRKMKPPGSDERFGEPWKLNFGETQSRSGAS